MFGLGHMELIMVMVVVMVIFGAGKLPRIGDGLGKALRNFKGAVSDGPSSNNPRIDQSIERGIEQNRN